MQPRQPWSTRAEYLIQSPGSVRPGFVCAMLRLRALLSSRSRRKLSAESLLAVFAGRSAQPRPQRRLARLHSIDSLRRLLKNARMPRCCQFSEDRKEPSAGLMGLRGPHLPASRSATDKLGDTARAEKWRNPGGKKGSHPFLGANPLGHHGRVRGPSPHRRRSSVTAPSGDAPSSLHRYLPQRARA